MCTARNLIKEHLIGKIGCFLASLKQKNRISEQDNLFNGTPERLNLHLNGFEPHLHISKKADTRMGICFSGTLEGTRFAFFFP